jgi:hypothetical protein
MKSQNPIKSWRRNLLGVAVVVSVGATGYLLLDEDGALQSTGKISGRDEQRSSLPEHEGLSFGGGTPAGAPGKAVMQTPPPLAGHALLRLAGPVAGVPLTEASNNPDADKGRVAPLSPINTAGWSRLRTGDSVLLPGFSDADALEGTVNIVQVDGGWIRIGGELKDGAGSFSLNQTPPKGTDVWGGVLRRQLGVGSLILLY